MRLLMGHEGTLIISESEQNYASRLYRDPNAPAWDEWVRKGYITIPESTAPPPGSAEPGR